VTHTLISFFLLAVLVIATLGGTFLLRNFLTKRAMFKVVRMFYYHHALGIRGAKTLNELGLQRPDFIQRMMRPRDYRQYALQILIKNGIVEANPDGTAYMIEERLPQHLKELGTGPHFDKM